MFKFLPIDSAKCLKCPRTVGDGVLFLRAEFGIGLLKFRQIKHGVISKAPLSLRCKQDLSGALAARDDLPAIRPEAGDDADELRRAAARRNILQVCKQIADALGIGVFVAVAGGIDARRTAQCIHAQPRIVSQDGQAAGLHDGLGLEKRIFLKGRAGLVDVDIEAVFGLERDLKAEPGQDRR